MRRAEARDQHARRARRPRSCRSATCSTASPASFPAASASASRSAAPSCASRKIFLFDEPLSNLDAELRMQMRVEINKLHRRLGVDHDLRHPRPGRGDDACRPHRRAARRASSSRSARRSSSTTTRQPVRRRLHRQPADELPAAARSPAARAATPGLELESRPDAVGARRGRADAAGDKVTSASGRKTSRSSRPARRTLSGEVQIAEHLGGETFVYVTLPPASHHGRDQGSGAGHGRRTRRALLRRHRLSPVRCRRTRHQAANLTDAAPARTSTAREIRHRRNRLASPDVP